MLEIYLLTLWVTACVIWKSSHFTKSQVSTSFLWNQIKFQETVISREIFTKLYKVLWLSLVVVLNNLLSQGPRFSRSWPDACKKIRYSRIDNETAAVPRPGLRGYFHEPFYFAMIAKNHFTEAPSARVTLFEKLVIK